MDAIERTLQTKNFLWYNFLFWLGICVFEVFRTYAFSNSFGYYFEAGYLIRWPISVYLTFWLLSFLVFRGFIFTRNINVRSFIIIHIISSVIFGMAFWIISPLIGLLLERLFLESETVTAGNIWSTTADRVFDIVFGVLVYWGIMVFLIGISYYRRFQDQYAKRIDLEKQLGMSQLKSMKMQLQPHFLFNAFNTITMMVRQNRNKEAVSMITNLGDMLRQSLSKESIQFVRLEDEIDLLKKYLSIESERYKERLIIEWDLDEELSDCQVPSLVLQPIVENAFKHGISKNLDSSILKISTSKVDDTMVLEVFNTGSALPSNWNFQVDKGIGMANTSSRLLKLYKEDFKFLINEKENGVSVALHLPMSNGSKN